VAGQLEKIRGDIAAGAEFGGMAREYSKSPTAPSGGDLGWFAINELLPEFREQAVALSEGEMSPVFVHGKGAHLILLAEVKKGELMPLDNVRDKIQDIIYQQEAMERYDLWLERLKVRTHIENRLKEADSPHHLNP
jgi:parvulin-like peptidyl-prolyl isomerase